LADALLARGEEVRGVDCFTDYYSRDAKERNLTQARVSGRFQFTEADLTVCNLDALLDGVSTVYHLAAQPGVRTSWGAEFQVYTRNNILATQRLLEAARLRPSLGKLVYASSSSVYGDALSLPQRETDLCRPVSPYGVSKLAAEHLCYLYWKNFGVPTVALRFFTVYGPRQRPDIAFHKFLRAAHEGGSICVYGDGEQTRDFTYIDDVVAGILSAASSSAAGDTFNLGGGACTSLNQVLDWIFDLTGGEPTVQRLDSQKGDVRDTLSDATKARTAFGFEPKTDPRTGLKREWDWLRPHLAASS